MFALKMQFASLHPRFSTSFIGFFLGATLRDIFIFSRWMRLTYVLIFCVLIGFVIPYFVNRSFKFTPENNASDGTCHVKPGLRTDCFPEKNILLVTREMCESRRCCYQPLNIALGAPVCHHTIPSYHTVNATKEAGQTGNFQLEPAYSSRDFSWLEPKWASPRMSQRQVRKGHVALAFYDDVIPDVGLGDDGNVVDAKVHIRNESVALNKPDER